MDDIIKNLVSHNVVDKSLNKEIDIKYLGQGMQRHLIYTLLKLSSKYVDKKASTKKEFSPDFTLIIFEEPEAFLHPCQQEYLNYSLRSLADEPGQQIAISTHSPLFVSKNIEDISSIIRLKRENGVTNAFHVPEAVRKTLTEQNSELSTLLKAKLIDPSVDSQTKGKIKELLGDTDDSIRMEEEAIRYMLWLDSERCSAFFSDMVLICEGATEKIFIDYLIKNEWTDLREKRSYILDAMCKFNIHRYMNLFKEMGIRHSVLADRDENSNVHGFINEFIDLNKNEFTIAIDYFDKDIESFLGIPMPPRIRKDKKPLNVMWNYSKGNITPDSIAALKAKVKALL